MQEKIRKACSRAMTFVTIGTSVVGIVYNVFAIIKTLNAEGDRKC